MSETAINANRRYLTTGASTLHTSRFLQRSPPIFPLAVKLRLPSYCPDTAPETPRLQRQYRTVKLLGGFVRTSTLLPANMHSFKIMCTISARISLPLSVSKKWLTLESSSTIDIGAWQSNTLPSSDRLVKREWWSQLKTSPRGTIKPGWLIRTPPGQTYFLTLLL